jgi:hypothetical protein
VYFGKKLFTKVIKPILPANIKNIISILDQSDKTPVIPLDNPTVPNAETASKVRSIGFNPGSRIIKTIEADPKTKIEAKIIENDFCVLC